MIDLSKPFPETFAAVEKATCFVPFIGGEAERIERQAIAAKRCFGLADGASIEPRIVAADIGVCLVDSHEKFDCLPAEIRAHILGPGAKHWSAGTLEGPAGPLIIVNPTHAPTRVKVTIAEELAHLVIGHPPSEIDPATGMRTYNRSVEEEAFGVGGALVMPYGQLFRMAKAGRSTREIATAFAVSDQMANYRINRAGLRRMYAKRRTA